MKNSPIQICNATVHPGESLSMALPLPELFSCAPLYMPIRVIHGKQAGPVMLVIGAMHGNELNGTEIINRLVDNSNLKQLRGTLITIPVLNVYGLMNRSRQLPGGIDLDTVFPGSKNGTHASRMAHTFINEIFHHADVCIDLQSGFLNYTNLPQIFADLSNEKTAAIAEAFNAPVITNNTGKKGSLRQYATKQNIPYLTYEAGEAMHFNEYAIEFGLKGILDVMRSLDMLKSTTKKSTTAKNFKTEKNIWVRASTSGISYTQHELGSHVQRGEVLCEIKDPFSAAESVKIKSPEEAIIVGKNNLPLTHEGEALFQLAVFSKMKHAATHLEEWEEKSGHEQSQ